ncbi:SGNH/GDSL hydrolase family protein [Nocardia sp. NPDC051570]|uniref:SGNH/GDSL hydrolase family protein n=1 Tax=Nocardia sp. NPDC051570 TaxID=3364324 RepID=UPI0037B5186F
MISVLSAGSWATVSAAPPSVGKYVALGDSYAAVGTLTTIDPRVPGCARAADNYPGDLARLLGAGQFVDVTCGQAVTADMFAPQVTPVGVNPPQLDALTEDTDLVTITVGGNDFGVGDLFARCGALAVTDPTGAPCRDSLGLGGDQLAARAAYATANMRRVFDEIHRRAPHATVVSVDYLRPLPPTGTCRWQLPVADGDAVFFNEMWDRYRVVASAEMAERGALFADVGAELGHDACQPPGVRWVEPPIPAAPYVAGHPNAAGQAYVAAYIADLLRR